jgi:hypothetical protein
MMMMRRRFAKMSTYCQSWIEGNCFWFVSMILPFSWGFIYSHVRSIRIRVMTVLTAPTPQSSREMRWEHRTLKVFLMNRKKFRWCFASTPPWAIALSTQTLLHVRLYRSTCWNVSRLFECALCPSSCIIKSDAVRFVALHWYCVFRHDCVHFVLALLPKLFLFPSTDVW